MPISRRTMKRPIRPPSSGSTARVGLEPDLRFRVERVAEAVAEDVEREHGQQDHRARHDRQQRRAGISSKPVEIIVPQEEFGAWTPAPRNESADSSSMLLAMLSVKKTMIVDEQVRQELAEHHPQRPGALGDRRLDELFLAQRKHLAAQRSRHVGDVDDADDQRRDPDRGPRDRDRPDLEPADRQRGPERDPEQQDGEGPDDVEDAGDDGIDPAAVVAGDQARARSRAAS